MAIISKGITLSYSAEGTSYTVLDDLQEIPELGGSAESLDVTTLADAAFVYTDGIHNYGDLGFKFLYATDQFSELNDLAGTDVQWKVELPDNTACSFKGVCSVKLDGVGVNAALTYTLTIKPSTEMTWG